MNTNFPRQYSKCCHNEIEKIMNESPKHRIQRCHPFFTSIVPDLPIRRPIRRKSMTNIISSNDHFCCGNIEKMHSSWSPPPVQYISFYNDDMITATSPDKQPICPTRMMTDDGERNLKMSKDGGKRVNDINKKMSIIRKNEKMA